MGEVKLCSVPVCPPWIGHRNDGEARIRSHGRICLPNNACYSVLGVLMLGSLLILIIIPHVWSFEFVNRRDWVSSSETFLKDPKCARTSTSARHVKRLPLMLTIQASLTVLLARYIELLATLQLYRVFFIHITDSIWIQQVRTQTSKHEEHTVT